MRDRTKSILACIVQLPFALSNLACARLDMTRPQHHETVYFPKTEFTDLTYDASVVDTFRAHLSFLREPSLFEADNRTFAIRCLWISPHKGDELVRIDARDGEMPIVTYKHAGMNGMGDLKKFSAKSFHKSKRLVAALMESTRSDHILDLTNDQDVLSNDGPTWLLEIFDHGRYHAVYRADPDPGPFSKTCLLTAQAAGVPADIQ